MAKTTIYLSEDLQARLAPYSNKLNLSSLCQGVLEEHLEKLERFDQSEKGKVLSRLFLTEVSTKEIARRGYQDGKEWSSREASLEELCHYGQYSFSVPADVNCSPRVTAWLSEDHRLMRVDIICWNAASSYMAATIDPIVKFPQFSEKMRVVWTDNNYMKAPLHEVYWKNFMNGIRYIYELVKDDLPSQS
jgi:hypothetical protein